MLIESVAITALVRCTSVIYLRVSVIALTSMTILDVTIDVAPEFSFAVLPSFLAKSPHPDLVGGSLYKYRCNIKI